MVGILYILICWLIGNVISYFIEGILSGSIIGMVIMFLGLQFKIIPSEKVKGVSKWILGLMALFFVPLGVGLIESYDLVLKNIWAILLAVVVSSVIIIAVSGYCFEFIDKKKWKQS